MADESKLREQQDRGAQAEKLFKHPLFREFVKKAEENLIEQFAKSELDDDRARHHARVGLGVLAMLERVFEECIRTGEFATKEMLLLKDEKQKD